MMKALKTILIAVFGFIIMALTVQLVKELVGKGTEKILSASSEIDQNKPWFRNSFYGVSVQTPYELEEAEAKAPAGYEEYLKTYKTYFSTEGGMIINLMYMDTKFDDYDVKTGIEGSINNMIYVMNGTNLNLEYQETNNNLDDLLCSGSFEINNTKGMVRGYGYWNEKGKVALIIGIGDNTDKVKNDLNKVIESIRIAF